MSFNVSEAPEWVLQYRNIWNKVESQLSEKLATGAIKGEGKYIHGKLNVQDGPYDIYCNATAVLRIDSVYKQGKNYHPHVYVEECKYADAEKRQCNMFSDDDDDEFLEM